MSAEQHDDFRMRRSAIIKTHLRNDPRIRAARRSMRLRVMRGAVSYTLILTATLILAKSVTMAVHDSASYRQLVAPAVANLNDTNIMYRALMPDALSAQIAGIIRPYLTADSGAVDPETRNSQVVPLTLLSEN
ncbi:hypothetical protein [Roseinatronobacter alkalisoli]|uniref:DUF3333 domain-containing protein n=1 Tax=Roseinatronobacter alkalisoli TaxID=3028235 RepID=A0ABT5TBM0_9RHOB|nr:hypothetical protein [Roseinatronobacter sp. HJB301]MDD7972396.1 hypothetical protein [Roseinatronobacter sp. HJB301]